MNDEIKEAIIANKKTIIKKFLIVGGAIAGLVLVAVVASKAINRDEDGEPDCESCCGSIEDSIEAAE